MLENGSVVDDNLSTGSYNEDWSELILQLSTILDLETVEARIYLNLLRLGPVTASSLAKELDVDRTKTYRTIDKLLNMSIVSTTISNPKLCIATKPEEVLKIVLQRYLIYKMIVMEVYLKIVLKQKELQITKNLYMYQGIFI